MWQRAHWYLRSSVLEEHAASIDRVDDMKFMPQEVTPNPWTYRYLQSVAHGFLSWQPHALVQQPKYGNHGNDMLTTEMTKSW